MTGFTGQELVRLNRYLSMCGVTSRRKADELLLAGKVVVNDRVVSDLGTKIDPRRDKVFVDGKMITVVHEYEYLVMNKPKDAITTLKDERGRRTVIELIRTKRRLFPIGRLDRNTTGVLLLTNDGEFAHRLMHPRFEIPKSYLATCDRKVTAEHLRDLRRGVELVDGRTAAAHVAAMPGKGGREIGITLHEGKNRQVRRMFESLGYEVKKLDRVAYGPVTSAELPRGSTRHLTKMEVRELRRLAGFEDDAGHSS